MKTTEIEARRIARRLGEAEGVRITEIVSRRTGDEGSVTKLDQSPLTGDLRWFTVKWDNHEGYSDGVEHYGWHAVQGNVVPVGETT